MLAETSTTVFQSVGVEVLVLCGVCCDYHHEVFVGGADGCGGGGGRVGGLAE